ncbi:MAG TPA: hypothetical protein VF092_18960 [Longimicrobium sp.]
MEGSGDATVCNRWRCSGILQRIHRRAPATPWVVSAQQRLLEGSPRVLRLFHDDRR